MIKGKLVEFYKSIKDKPIFIFLLCLEIFICIVIIYSLLRPTTTNTSQNLNKKIEISKTSEEVKGDNYEDIAVESWEIIDKSQNSSTSTGLKITPRDFYSSYYSPRLVKWKNYLIGINIDYFLDKVPDSKMNNKPTESTDLFTKINSLRILNLDSKESFDIFFEKPIIEPYNGDIIVQVFENKYYFGSSPREGFASFGYELDLPPSKNSKITKIDKPIGNKIEKIGNIYISQSCYEGCSYSLFNPSSFARTPLNRMNNADNGYKEDRAEKLIGIDNSGRMILNVRDTRSMKTTMIAAVPLQDENQTIPLLTSSELLDRNINNFFMIDGTNKILMIGGTKVFIYNFDQNKFSELKVSQKLIDSLLEHVNNSDSSKTLPNNIYSQSNGKELCLFTNSKEKDKKLVTVINLETETYSDLPPSECLDQNKEKTAEEIFKDLNLPSNFDLEYSQLNFQTYWRYQ